MRRKRRRRFPARRRQIPGAARGLPAEVKLPEVLVASSRLRLQRARWIQLLLVERNMITTLHARDSQRLGSYGRFTERTKTKLKGMAVSGDCQLRRTVVMSSTCGGSSCGSVSLVAPSLQRFPISRVGLDPHSCDTFEWDPHYCGPPFKKK